jgi:hypothetical protein
MRCLILFILLLFGTISFGEELPVVKFPTKKDIEKAEIKNLIKALDEKNKEETTKKEKQEPLQLNDSQNYLPHRPSSSKYYFKKNKSKLLCPT